MKKSVLYLNNNIIPVLSLDAVIIGSGCAGFNAADSLYKLGRKDIAIVSEGINMGTSRNTGSDKQTYYKLSLGGDVPDSVSKMTEDLFAGEGVNGDTALAEAAGSVRSFLKLADLGVPFPTNRYGEYVGYQTDHDLNKRATSAGPLTSRYMTEALEKSVRQNGTLILDRMLAFRLLVSDGKTEGILCLDMNALEKDNRGLTVISARNIIMATGGPAHCYAQSVYPESQTGMSGMALEAGAEAANLQEWQYGLASLKFRWNVSGSYQQVLPRYISIDNEGVEREFLSEHISDPAQMLNRIFCKGYQWPFDSRKAEDSSLIDLLVWRETMLLGRRVYLDFRSEPQGLQHGFDVLGQEAYSYLKNSRILLPTPIQRLQKLNPQAIELYRTHGIDLAQEPLEIGVCAQHHNGGLAVDADWQTSIQGLYAAGEAAGTFGVYRPGGSALNATQVGSLRAAEHIARTTTPDLSVSSGLEALVKTAATEFFIQTNAALKKYGSPINVSDEQFVFQTAMSRCSAHIRIPEEMKDLENQIKNKLSCFWEESHIDTPYELPALFKYRDMLITQLAILSAMQLSATQRGSCGAALVQQTDGKICFPILPELHFAPNIPQTENLCLITGRKDTGFLSFYHPVRPIPQRDCWFETVWADYEKRTKRALQE